MGVNESRAEARAGSQLCLSTARSAGSGPAPEEAAEYPLALYLLGKLSQTSLLSPGWMNWPFNTGSCY